MSAIDPYREQLLQYWQKDNDPSVLYYERLLQWKGAPTFRFGARPSQTGDGLHSAISPLFSIFVYQQNPLFDVFCTVGASRTPLPHSTRTTRDPRGMRHEYIMHANNVYAEAACEILLLVSEHPHANNIDIGPGFVMPIGEPLVKDSALEYLYFTYPFLDDPHIYDAHPAGEIDHPNAYTQVIWVIPITRAERQFLRTSGVDAFEAFLHEQHRERYDADFLRNSLM